MNTEINKQISQFLDGELHQQELESLLGTISKKPGLKNKLDRYQAISHVIRTDEFVKTNKDFLNNINQQIKQEPHHFLPKQRNKRKAFSVWQKTSVAMAASIACVSIVVSQQDLIQYPSLASDALIISQQDDLTTNKVKASENIKLVAQKQSKTPHLAVAKINDQKQNIQHERFKAYLQAHSDDLYTHGSLNVQPYARVAGYGQE